MATLEIQIHLWKTQMLNTMQVQDEF
jgi:hypothetical protein